MVSGYIKTKKCKIFAGSFGKTRPAKSKPATKRTVATVAKSAVVAVAAPEKKKAVAKKSKA